MCIYGVVEPMKNETQRNKGKLGKQSSCGSIECMQVTAIYLFHELHKEVVEFLTTYLITIEYDLAFFPS